MFGDIGSSQIDSRIVRAKIRVFILEKLLSEHVARRCAVVGGRAALPAGFLGPGAHAAHMLSDGCRKIQPIHAGRHER